MPEAVLCQCRQLDFFLSLLQIAAVPGPAGIVVCRVGSKEARSGHHIEIHVHTSYCLSWPVLKSC